MWMGSFLADGSKESDHIDSLNRSGVCLRRGLYHFRLSFSTDLTILPKALSFLRLSR
jgi:hypothetical protein